MIPQYHNMELFVNASFECFKCHRNQDHPDYKGHLWSRNVGYHYKNYLFGCSDKELSFSVVFLRLEMGVPEMIFVYFIRRIVLYNTYITKQIYISVQVV